MELSLLLRWCVPSSKLQRVSFERQAIIVNGRSRKTAEAEP